MFRHFILLVVFYRFLVMGGFIVVGLVKVGVSPEANGAGLLTFLAAFGVEPLIIFVLLFGCARRTRDFVCLGGDDCGHSVLSCYILI